jgi:hypothetical protein
MIAEDLVGRRDVPPNFVASKDAILDNGQACYMEITGLQ